MFTRKEYLAAPHDDREAAHRRYYGEIVEAMSLRVQPLMVEKCKAALANGDTALNTISLHIWDAQAASIKARAVPHLTQRGDFWSIGGGVCILKEAARRQAEAVPA